MMTLAAITGPSLMKLGFSEVEADNLIAAGLGFEAEKLLQRGCSTVLAWRILRP